MLPIDLFARLRKPRTIWMFFDKMLETFYRSLKERKKKIQFRFELAWVNCLHFLPRNSRIFTKLLAYELKSQPFQIGCGREWIVQKNEPREKWLNDFCAFSNVHKVSVYLSNNKWKTVWLTCSWERFEYEIGYIQNNSQLVRRDRSGLVSVRFACSHIRVRFDYV